MLKVNTLGCERDNHTLFSNLTFEVMPGSALVISGSNGVGKTTLLKILVGLRDSEAGSVSWRGQNFCSSDPRFLSELLYIGHKIGIQSALTPIQNLQWLLRVSGRTALTEISFALQAVGLEGLEDLPCDVLSKGQCQRVALARLWLDSAKCWILDEPFTALDDTMISLLQKKFVKHLNAGGILVIATHHKIALEPFLTQEIQLGKDLC